MRYSKIFVFLSVLIFAGGCVLMSEIVRAWPVEETQGGERPVCDAALWDYVYKPGRLEILNPCIRVTGEITNVRVAADGDYHVNLRLDSPYRHLLNDWNTRRQNGDLVLEPVCQKEAARHKTQAIKACKGFSKSKIMVIPEVGTRVAVVGSYVLDMGHGGWAEIHPVTSIVPLP